MDDTSIAARITSLVEEEHRLRQQLQERAISPEEEHTRLRDLEQQLDQCWDLLRRRRAARDTSGNPDSMDVRTVDEVEHYLQ